MALTKHTLLILTIVLAFSCTSPETKQNVEVAHHGALKQIMHKSDYAAKADLADLQEIKNLYALGAVENLQGEILILNSEPFISSVQDSALKISNSFDHKATLLVYAPVQQWSTQTIPDSVVTYENLETYIRQIAADIGIDVDSPFPFLLTGMVKSVDWHVINFVEGIPMQTHEDHIKSGLQGTLENRDVTILGFYSDKHHAIFTHHSTNMHLHVKTTDNKISGHLDGLILGNEMLLKLPLPN